MIDIDAESTPVLSSPTSMEKSLLEKLVIALLDEKKESTPTEVPFHVGKSYFIRTVTYHLTGRVKKIVGTFVILEDAAWIADSGRFSDAIAKGTMNEVEPVDEAIVNMSAIVDAFEFAPKLPRIQK